MMQRELFVWNHAEHKKNQRKLLEMQGEVVFTPTPDLEF